MKEPNARYVVSGQAAAVTQNTSPALPVSFRTATAPEKEITPTQEDSDLQLIRSLLTDRERLEKVASKLEPVEKKILLEALRSATFQWQQNCNFGDQPSSEAQESDGHGYPSDDGKPAPQEDPTDLSASANEHNKKIPKKSNSSVKAKYPPSLEKNERKCHRSKPHEGGFDLVVRSIEDTRLERHILSHRGGGCNQHRMNEAYRVYVDRRAVDYVKITKPKEKFHFSQGVLDKLHAKGTRVLAMDKHYKGPGQRWFEIDDDDARTKISQRLNETGNKIRNQKTAVAATPAARSQETAESLLAFLMDTTTEVTLSARQPDFQNPNAEVPPFVSTSLETEFTPWDELVGSDRDWHDEA